MKTTKNKSAQKRLTIELIPDTEIGGFTAHVPNISAYGEGETEKEAIADLKAALSGYIETFGLEDALSRIAESPKVCFVPWDLKQLAHA